MSEQLLAVDIRKKLREFELQVRFTSGKGCLGILGPSGCGKSMTLKSIAGIVEPDSGSIVLDNRTLYDSRRKQNLKPQERRVGYLFQNYALFPNMSVEENIRTGLKAGKRYDEAQQKKRTAEMMKRFRLGGLEKRYPAQLSGGQQQRVAIARALATDPEIIYFDEPTSALDPELTGEVLGVMRQLAKEGMTMLVVTHEMGFARNVSNKVVFMENGVVVEEGPSKEFFANPREERTRTFLQNIEQHYE